MTVRFIVATDGSAAPNPGAGSFAYIIRAYEEDDLLLLEKTAVYAVSGKNTSNRMELRAILYAIYAVEDTMDELADEYSLTVTVYSDSQNAVNWLNGTFDINNPDILQYVRDIHHAIIDAHIRVDFKYVAGHSHVRPDMLREQRMNIHADEMIRALRKENTR